MTHEERAARLTLQPEARKLLADQFREVEREAQMETHRRQKWSAPMRTLDAMDMADAEDVEARKLAEAQREIKFWGDQFCNDHALHRDKDDTGVCPKCERNALLSRAERIDMSHEERIEKLEGAGNALADFVAEVEGSPETIGRIYTLIKAWGRAKIVDAATKDIQRG